LERRVTNDYEFGEHDFGAGTITMVSLDALCDDPANPHEHDHNEVKRLVHSINTHGWHGVVQASIRRTVIDTKMVDGKMVKVIMHVIINGHARCEAARLCHLDEVPVEWVEMPDYQEEQLATALDAPYGHWNEGKLKDRLQKLERLHLDMDNVCLPPFDTAKYALSAEPLWHDTPARENEIPPTPSESPPNPSESTPTSTGTDTRPVTITIVDGRDLDGGIIQRIQAAIDEWKSIGLTVKVR
jgi:hypothetical protein